MRTTEYGEICISIDTHTVAERAYKGNRKVGKESKVAERQRERVWDKETHLVIIDSKHL
jgi:hypothetical protein